MDVALWERRIVANTSAFQAEDAGSIPVIPSKFHRSACSRRERFLRSGGGAGSWLLGRLETQTLKVPL